MVKARFAPVVFMLAMLVAVATFWGCGNRSDTAQNVVFISIDTLRADHVGAYGYKPSPTPELDKLAQLGVVFENAISQSSWTTPAHASMFTGLLASAHGAAQLNVPIRKEVPLLAEYLKDAGMSTAAFVTHIFVGKHLGFDRGFDSFWMQDDARASEPIGAAMDWLAKNRKQRFFVFIHLFDPHFPYAPPQEYTSKYDPLCQRAKGAYDLMNALFQLEGPRKAKALDCVVQRYDDEIRYADLQVGRLVEFLQKEKLLRRTMLIVTSDHGEEFLDHGSVLHGVTLYQEMIHVPLIISGPGLGTPGSRIASRVSTMDLAPTVLEVLGIPPRSKMQAASLLPYLRGQEKQDRDVIAESSDVGPDRLALIKGQFKYFYVPRANLFGRQMNEWLFDLNADPHERYNLVAGNPEVIDSMRRDMVAQGGYKWRRSWKIMWGGQDTGARREGGVTTSGRFTYAFKYQGAGSDDESSEGAPLLHLRQKGDYQLQRGDNRAEWKAMDQGQENGLILIAEPVSALMKLTLTWTPNPAAPNKTETNELELNEDIDPGHPLLIGGGAFHVYSEPILTLPDAPPPRTAEAQDLMPKDLKGRLRQLGYF